ncbi:methyltransferase domain-containing protein [Nocardioides sp. T5]|uniref:methyltransferase domain-containing protein n=1 Tax=Nocardioides sp. T5 TaxID=3400182 RepID=UPI003A8C7345
MLIRESEWVGRALQSLPDDAFPLVNVGCQTKEFRETTQPWMTEHIFGPLAASGREVIHVDIRPDVGVDLVADATSTEGQAAIRATGARSVLCTNLLEHVPDPSAVLDHLAAMVPVGGYLVVTGPLRFPYHADPIDTMYRPTASEMAEEIGPAFTVVKSEDILCERGARFYSFRPRGRIRLVARLLTPFIRYKEWKVTATWAFRRTSAYAVVAQRAGS